MNKEKSIEVLNTLIEINNDRIAGYETASKETEESDLKSLFSGLKQTSEMCSSELISEVVKLGGKPIEGTKTTGKLYRVWMDIKSALTGKDRKTILSSCEFGEDMAVDTYQKVLRDNLSDITSDQQTMLNSQLAKIKAGHDKVKTLRDALVGVK
jgi:uncharacterized protein (TIGR02284 family)